jgi:hypothetical protein
MKKRGLEGVSAMIGHSQKASNKRRRMAGIGTGFDATEYEMIMSPAPSNSIASVTASASGGNLLVLRQVKPYAFLYSTNTKGRWLGQTLANIFAKEFDAHPDE